MSTAKYTQGESSDTCEDLIRRLSGYVDGDVSEAERRAIVAHLDVCPCCRAMAEGLQQTVEMCRKAMAAGLPADVRARARARIAELLASKDDHAGQ